MANDQAEADEDMSIKQRLILAGGSAVGGASEMVDNEVISSAMEGVHVCVCVCVCVTIATHTNWYRSVLIGSDLILSSFQVA